MACRICDHKLAEVINSQTISIEIAKFSLELIHNMLTVLEQLFRKDIQQAVPFMGKALADSMAEVKLFRLRNRKSNCSD